MSPPRWPILLDMDDDTWGCEGPRNPLDVEGPSCDPEAGRKSAMDSPPSPGVGLLLAFLPTLSCAAVDFPSLKLKY
jgi:hypothetical protein